MGEDKTKVDYEMRTTLDEAIAKLEGLIEGLKAKQLVLRNHTEVVELRPPSVVSLSVKAKQKGARQSIEIHLEWKNDQRRGEENPGDRSIGPRH
jgi:amphi-Trp domain-containing protein